MDDSNIVAIPHHPPLPRTVSGIFPSDGHSYIPSASGSTSANKNPPPIASADRSSEDSTPLSHFAIRQEPAIATAAAATAAAAVHTHHHRGSSGSMPRNTVGRSGASMDLTSDADNCPLGLRRASISHGSLMRAAAMTSTVPRRDSVASNASTAISTDNNGNTETTQTFSSDLPLSSTLKRRRRESVASNNSTAFSVGEKSAGSGERKYMCDWKDCGQAFDRIEHLNRHKRRHTGEKPYRCLISKCSKLFSRFDNMMQHVGIHTVDGKKTGIPNIKNDSAKGNGRGRARRTSYRASQDPHEKFRRHVDGVLGSRLSACCILPTDNPDFSNLTLRPLLNTEPTLATPSGTTAAAATVPLAAMRTVASLLRSPEQQDRQSEPKRKKRARCDSVVDGMDKHPMAAYGHMAASPSSSPLSHSSISRSDVAMNTAGAADAAGGGYMHYRIIHPPPPPPPPQNAKTSGSAHYPQHRSPPYPGVASTIAPPSSSSSVSTRRPSFGMFASAFHSSAPGISNVRSQPEYRKEMHS
ncbi:hypothetical protein GGI12_000981 [Dipsacomyces acuminosporus]|nr:hypothetical protein GGI12_000981 [Dipsacomyces acuminosporus]